MPKRQLPWPQNLIHDFHLPADTTPEAASQFISSLPISDRNKTFLHLRYKADQTFTQIATEHGMTPAGVRLAIIAAQEKYAKAASMATPAPMAVPTNPTPMEAEPTPAPVETIPEPRNEPTPVGSEARPLSLNLTAIRRFLGLTQEEFARPIIEDGEALINRLEVGLSRPSQDILRLICDAWDICKSYLLTGTGPMFEMDAPSRDHAAMLIRLLRKYLSVATFDQKGNQYWKEALVDDLSRLIDVKKLSSREMCQVIRLLYDHLDVEQFTGLLEGMGR